MWGPISLYSHKKQIAKLWSFLFWQVFSYFNVYFLKEFIYFLDRGEGRKKERERNINASHVPCTREPGLQLRHVPWLGIELATLWSVFNPLSHTSQGLNVYFSCEYYSHYKWGSTMSFLCWEWPSHYRTLSRTKNSGENLVNTSVGPSFEEIKFYLWKWLSVGTLTAKENPVL